MENKFLIVLFKNKQKRKIIKCYSKESNAKNKFLDLVNKNKNVLFEKVIENATLCEYELGLLTNTTNIQKSLFITDDIGRNLPVNLENPDYVFLDIKKFKIEETIFDWQKQKKITVNEMVKTYCSDKDLKSIYTLNNKLCVQKDLDVFIFSLKDKFESERLLDVLQTYFMDNSRSDAFFVKDISTTQRKWLYELLETKGFDKKRLYRLKTTFSKR